MHWILAQIGNLVLAIQSESHRDVVHIYQIRRARPSNHTLNHDISGTSDKVEDFEFIVVELVGNGGEKWKVGGGSSLPCVSDAGGVARCPPGGAGGEVAWKLVPLAV